jgi:hypothetical protein
MSPAKKIIVVLSAIVGCCLLLTSCSPTNGLDGGTQTGNARVTGKLYLSDGHTPAAHATLHIRKKTTLADTSGLGHSKMLADTTATVTTNDTGGFAIDSVDPGLYVIEGAKDSDVVLIDSVAVTSQDSTVTLPPDTLRPAGALKGIIYLSEGGDPRKVFILAFGIDRFSKVNVDGSFKFSNLAEARYNLRIISSLDNYGVLDTFGISINSADTTNMDTIRLPFTGIPTPKNLNIAYDTLRQIVILTWAKADTALVKGYNVYRRNVDSNTILARINTSIITDTIYRDSSGLQNMTYEYKIVAVSPNDMEGTKSSSASTTITSFYNLADSVSIIGNPLEAAVDNLGNLYVTVGTQVSKYSKILDKLYDLPLTQDTAAVKFSTAWGIDTDDSNYVYIADNNGIAKFSPDGNFIANFFQNDSLGLRNGVRELTIHDSLIYLATSQAIVIFDLAGNYKTNWPVTSFVPQSIGIIDSFALVYCQPDQILKFKIDGTQTLSSSAITFLPVSGYDHLSLRGIEVTSGKIYAVSSWAQKVIEFMPNGEILTTFSIAQIIPSKDTRGLGISISDSTVYVLEYNRQKMFVYKR